jgi:CBS domain-containing protein
LAEQTTGLIPALVCADCGFTNEVEQAECEACGTSLYRTQQAGALARYDDPLLSDLVDVLASSSPLLVAAGTSVADAIALMRERRTGYVLVAEAGQISGIFTGHDLLERVTAAGHAPRAVAIEQVMTRDPVVLRHDDTLAVAIHKMVMGSFRHIPLVDADGRIDGVLSAHQVLEHLHRLLHLSEQEG